jgi:hypothetical protein
LILGIIDLVANKGDGKKHIGSWFAIIFSSICIIVFALTLGESTTKEEQENAAQVSQVEVENQVAQESDITNDESSNITEENELDIEVCEIYSGNGITITTDSVKTEKEEIDIRLVLENNSEKDYKISAHTYSINGLMAGSNLYGFGSVELPSGKKSNLNIEIKKDWLEENDVQEISDIGIIFWAYYDGFKEWNTEIVEIKTNQYNESLVYSPSGEVVYQNENVDVWLDKKQDNKYYLSLKNKSKYNASYTIENMSVNGWSYELTNYTYDLYDEDIHSNSVSNFEIEIDEDFLKENGIDEINDIEFDISLKDDYWDSVMDIWKYTTDKINIGNK